jgi:hypothetical protein
MVRDVWRSRLLRLLPSVVLVAVAATQIALAKAGVLTPWKGGGFGMFSTLDHLAYRGVEVIVEGPGRSEGLEIPPSLDTIAARAAAFPADWPLRRLAEGVVERERRYERPISRVAITPWRVEFDGRTLAANEQPMRTFTYEVR